MKKSIRKNIYSSSVLEPKNQKIVSARYVAQIGSSEIENIDKIEFSPPKVGDDHFGKFKVTYKTPYLCDVN